ncbi:FtsX-like permease family protein [Nonomuraea pusilla]|uniref:ABC transporter permease n=1 Tax=Nonomuraea pusilla TaxID=46177 RepID=UPI0033270514
MVLFALRTLRHRKAAFAGAFVALLCASALVCGCGMLLETGLRGGAAPERYAAAPVLVAGDRYVRETVDKGDGRTKVKAKSLTDRRWVPSSLAGRLAAVPGVGRVVTEVTFPAVAGGRPFWGHGWESAGLTPFTLRSGRAPRAGDELVADARAGLAAGARTDVETPAGHRTYRVVGVTAEALPSQGTLFFATGEARRLAGRPGLVSAIGVFPRAGAPAPDLTPALAGGAVAYTGDERGAVEFPDAEQARLKLVSLGGALGGTSLLVAILVVVGTFALSTQQRQREIALLRAVAATPAQVRAMLSGEALLAGAVAGALGSALGVGLGFWLRSAFVALGAMPENLRLVVSPFPALAAPAATVAAAWAAARISARRTARIRPVEALGEAALPVARLPLGRALAGAGCAAGGVALTLVLSGLTSEAASGPVTMLTALVWTVAVALLAPALAGAAVAPLAKVLRASRVAGHLAAANLRTGSRRLASVITPLSLMTAMTCTILFAQTTMGDAAQEQAAAGARADYVLAPQVSRAAADAVRRVPGVEAVTETLRTSVRVGLERFPARAVTSPGLLATLDPGVVSGSLDGFGAGSVAVSGTAASRLGVTVGSPLRLALGDGAAAALRVSAVYERGLGLGDLLLPYELVRPHVDDPTSTVLVSAPTLGRAELERAVPGVAVLDRVEATAASAPNADVNLVAMGLIIAFTAIAAVNTLAMATSGRSRELALLRLVGTTRRQVLWMLRLETLAAVLVSAVTGTAVALVTLAAFSRGMTGSALPYVPLPAYLAVVGSAAALALAATLLPARVVLRARPVEALGARA